MPYGLGELIEAVDYNAFVANVNIGWNVGTGSSGYGQAPLVNVAQAALIYARPTTQSGSPPAWAAVPEWRPFIDTINAMNGHQTGVIPVNAADFLSTSLPLVGTIISYGAPVVPTVTAVRDLSQRLDAASQGSTATYLFTNTVSWNTQLSTTFTITFTNGDNAARYFFNAGGQFGIQFSHPSGVFFDINRLINDLCLDVGTVWLSSTNGSPPVVSLAGSNYSGVTQIGGGYPAGLTIKPNDGFYSWTAVPRELVKQTSNFGFPPYDNTYLTISASYNGAGVITITTLLDLVPDGGLVSPGTTITITTRYPSTTYLIDTWNPITISTGAAPPAIACSAPASGAITI
jgi:hypothetical protein